MGKQELTEDRELVVIVFHKPTEDPSVIIATCNGVLISDKEEPGLTFIDLESKIEMEYLNFSRRYFKLSRKNLQQSLKESPFTSVVQILNSGSYMPLISELNRKGNVIEDSDLHRMAVEVSKTLKRRYDIEDLEEHLKDIKCITRAIDRKYSELYKTVYDYAYFEYNKLEVDKVAGRLGYWLQVDEVIKDFEPTPMLLKKSWSNPNRNTFQCTCRIGDLDYKSMKDRVNPSILEIAFDAKIVNNQWQTFNPKSTNETNEWIRILSHQMQNMDHDMIASTFRCTYVGERVMMRK